MNCPVCSAPCQVRTGTAVIGKKRVYEYEEWYCKNCPVYGWQDEYQFQKELDSMKAAKEAAAKLEKATT